jgi:RNA polymerase-binding transcription factor DksA
MKDVTQFSDQISDRLNQLGIRMHDIDSELSHLKTSDLQDQAIDLEDDEVLESLGTAAQKEVILLRQAMKRIEEGTYGTCLECEQAISKERLKAVPYAPLCKRCAGAVKR